MFLQEHYSVCTTQKACSVDENGAMFSWKRFLNRNDQFRVLVICSLKSQWKCFILRHLNCLCLNNVYIYCLHLLAILTQAAQLQADMVAIHRNLKELAAVQVKEGR